jgi:hypothetical protein
VRPSHLVPIAIEGSAEVVRHGSGAAGGLVLSEQPPHDGERRADLGERGALDRDGHGSLLPASRVSRWDLPNPLWVSFHLNSLFCLPRALFVAIFFFSL